MICQTPVHRASIHTPTITNNPNPRPTQITHREGLLVGADHDVPVVLHVVEVSELEAALGAPLHRPLHAHVRQPPPALVLGHPTQALASPRVGARLVGFALRVDPPERCNEFRLARVLPPLCLRGSWGIWLSRVMGHACTGWCSCLLPGSGIHSTHPPESNHSLSPPASPLRLSADSTD